MYITINIFVSALYYRQFISKRKRRIFYIKNLCQVGGTVKRQAWRYRWIEDLGYDFKDISIVATGYGRVSVPYANKTVTEITCHAKSASHMFKDDVTVIDIGGQDAKIIKIKNGNVMDFLMNDKCSAGTGKFLEIMANRLGLSLEEMFEYAKKGKEVFTDENARFAGAIGAALLG